MVQYADGMNNFKKLNIVKMECSWLRYNKDIFAGGKSFY